MKENFDEQINWLFRKYQFITDEHYDFCDIDEIEADEELSLNFRMALLSDLIMILVYAQLIKNKLFLLHRVTRCFVQRVFKESYLEMK